MTTSKNTQNNPKTNKENIMNKDQTRESIAILHASDYVDCGVDVTIGMSSIVNNGEGTASSYAGLMNLRVMEEAGGSQVAVMVDIHGDTANFASPGQLLAYSTARMTPRELLLLSDTLRDAALLLMTQKDETSTM